MRPLAGIRIIEIASIGPGPMCAMLLADLGAEVICVGRPGGVSLGLPVARLGQVMLGAKGWSRSVSRPSFIEMPRGIA